MPTYHPAFHQSSKKSRGLVSLEGFLVVNLVLLGCLSFFWSSPSSIGAPVPGVISSGQSAVQEAALQALATSFSADLAARLRREESVETPRGSPTLPSAHGIEASEEAPHSVPLAASLAAVHLAAAATAEAAAATAARASPPPGVVVLGMHRSGTSLLTGLLFRGGLWVGDRRDLIWGASATDNAKGFFERTDVVLQNDYLMKHQKVHWSVFGDRFDAAAATQAVAAGSVEWQQYGAKAVQALVLADHKGAPWVLKDPRLCLTLRFWLPWLSGSTKTADSVGGSVGGVGGPQYNAIPPAVLFTYRHPVEVAKSLQKREGFGVKRGLLLWLAYNEMALQQSQGLCLVATSNAAINAAPLREVARVALALAQQCGLQLPRGVTAKDVAEFVDPSLQHNHAAVLTTADAAAPADAAANGSVRRGCDPAASWESFRLAGAGGQPGGPSNVRPGQRAALRRALEAFCALENGAALQGASRRPFYDQPLDWG